MAEFEGSAEKIKSDTSENLATDPNFFEATTDFLRQAIIFICYGPGVLGLLWLIGRILRR
jgi:hypothetical protein